MKEGTNIIRKSPWEVRGSNDSNLCMHVLHLLTYGPKLLAIKKHSTLSQTVPAMFRLAETLHHTSAVMYDGGCQWQWWRVPVAVPVAVTLNGWCSYCESGTPTIQPTAMWYTSDPLWDGMQCGGHEAPCCVSASMPWFTKNTTTTATINVRLCLDEDTNNENIGIERLELYVKWCRWFLVWYSHSTRLRAQSNIYSYHWVSLLLWCV